MLLLLSCGRAGNSSGLGMEFLGFVLRVGGFGVGRYFSEICRISSYFKM